MLKTIQSWGQKVLAFKKAYVEGRSGATAIEYALIAATVSIIIVTVFALFGDDMYNMFKNLGKSMKHTAATPKAPTG
jgi:Flp pilus assembly pilin Flp